jgi:hypothetical protein
MKKTLLAIALSCLALACCGHDNASSPSAGGGYSAVTSVDLAAVSTNGCLNAPLDLQRFLAMDPNLPIFKISTDFSLSSNKPVREAFRELMAYSTFEVKAFPLSETDDFPALSQDGCTSLVATAADGTEENYSVDSSSDSSISAKSTDGKSISFTWLGPKRMKVSTTYFAYDLPCGSDDPITVHLEQTYDWSQQVPEQITEPSPFYVNTDYLSLVAAAVGQPTDPLYQTGDDGQKSLLVAQLQALAAGTPSPAVLGCQRAAPEPSPAREHNNNNAP